jgi:protein tyrosine phosphatase (PTP) superfamily phosphohydrolase (DUF442 family)
MTMDISTTTGRIAPGSTCTWWTTARSAPSTTTSTTSAAACTAPASPARRRSQVPAKFGLRSIINLRGAHGYGSYALEKEACDKLGWRSTTSSCTRARRPRSRRCAMDELFKTIEYPALLHCKSGADRAGLGAALYRILHLGHRVEDAMAELGWKYGHFKRAKTGVLDSSSPPTWPATPVAHRLPRMGGHRIQPPRTPRPLPRGWASLIVDKVLHRE